MSAAIASAGVKSVAPIAIAQSVLFIVCSSKELCSNLYVLRFIGAQYCQKIRQFRERIITF